MSKPMIYTVPCGSNSVSDRDLLEQDGSGAVKAYDGTGAVIGVANCDKDGENNVAMLTKGLKKVAVGASGDYNVGDKLGVNSDGVVSFSSGTVFGRAAETKTGLVTSDLLLCEVDIVN